MSDSDLAVADQNVTVGSNPSFGRSYAIFFTSSKSANVMQIGAGLKVTFAVEASSQSYPNSATIRIYNAAPNTVNDAVSNGYDGVTLQAGYGSQPAVIFQGTIVQFKFGKESNIDTYLELLAVDGYNFHNYGYMNQSIENSLTQSQKVSAIANGFFIGPTSSSIPEDASATAIINQTKPIGTDAAQTYGGIIPRGVVLWGMGKMHLDVTSRTINGQWSIQNGTLTFTPTAIYKKSTVVIVNSATGMVGIPEATDQGINVTMLLNPLVESGTILQLSSADITQLQNVGSITPNTLQGGYQAPVATVTQGSGFYLVFAVSHRGDTRGDDWLTECICLALSPTDGTIIPSPTWSAQ